jgi:hypothetical protein
MSWEDCCITRNHPKIALRDRKGGSANATFLNEARRDITVCVVDGCLITDGRKCDYLIQDNGHWTILLELKGSDLEGAVEQIDQTLAHAAMRSKLRGKLGALVVCTKVRVPNATAYLLRCKQRYMKSHKLSFQTKVGGGEFCPLTLTGAVPP